MASACIISDCFCAVKIFDIFIVAFPAIDAEFWACSIFILWNLSNASLILRVSLMFPFPLLFSRDQKAHHFAQLLTALLQPIPQSIPHKTSFILTWKIFNGTLFMFLGSSSKTYDLLVLNGHSSIYCESLRVGSKNKQRTWKMNCWPEH